MELCTTYVANICKVSILYNKNSLFYSRSKICSKSATPTQQADVDSELSPHSQCSNPPKFVSLGTGCMETTPDYPWPCSSKHRNQKSDPKGSKCSKSAPQHCTCKILNDDSLFCLRYCSYGYCVCCLGVRDSLGGCFLTPCPHRYKSGRGEGGSKLLNVATPPNPRLPATLRCRFGTNCWTAVITEIIKLLVSYRLETFWTWTATC